MATRPDGKKAADEWAPLVYEELRRLARRRMARERPGQTLQTTALVHETYLRLAADGKTPWESRPQFLAAAAVAMRRILVERARRRRLPKHGGGLTRVSLAEGLPAPDAPTFDVLDLDEALTRLSSHDKRAADIVMLRHFAGLGIEETAQTLGVSCRTVKRVWTYAKAWLHEEMTRGPQRARGS